MAFRVLAWAEHIEVARADRLQPIELREHLEILLADHLLVMEKQGRCHYYRLRSAEVAHAIEELMTVAAPPVKGNRYAAPVGCR